MLVDQGHQATDGPLLGNDKIYLLLTEVTVIALSLNCCIAEIVVVEKFNRLLPKNILADWLLYSAKKLYTIKMFAG